jgi:hypothetical protein
MSHTDHCPDHDDARREGERAFDRGRHRWNNPYDGECDAAADEWRRGYGAAEQEDERRTTARREEAESEERYWQRQACREAEDNAAQEQEYFAMLDERRMAMTEPNTSTTDTPETPAAETTESTPETPAETPTTE